MKKKSLSMREKAIVGIVVFVFAMLLVVCSVITAALLIIVLSCIGVGIIAILLIVFIELFRYLFSKLKILSLQKKICHTKPMHVISTYPKPYPNYNYEQNLKDHDASVLLGVSSHICTGGES